MRFIEKISRPSDTFSKDKMARIFNEKVKELTEKLDKILRSISEKTILDEKNQ